jgi:hypothetical protein
MGMPEEPPRCACDEAMVGRQLGPRFLRSCAWTLAPPVIGVTCG